MALVQSLGRSVKLIYGAGATFTFRIKFVTPYIKNPTGLIRQYDKAITLVPQNNEPYFSAGVLTANIVSSTNAVVAGTITVAGVTVTLSASDVLTPTGVASAIASATYTSAFNTANYTVYSVGDQVYLTSKLLSATAVPTLTLGTATNILFFDTKFVQGSAIPTVFDDIFIQGRTPVTITVTGTGGTFTLISSTGTLQEQSAGTLAYGSAIALTGGMVTLTSPTNFIKVTNSGCTTISVWITR